MALQWATSSTRSASAIYAVRLTVVVALTAGCGPRADEAGASTEGSTSIVEGSSSSSVTSVTSQGAGSDTGATGSEGTSSTDGEVACTPEVGELETLCAVPELLGYEERVYVRSGTSPAGTSCVGEPAPCGGELVDTQWVVAEACLAATNGWVESWFCGDDTMAYDSFSEEGTLAFSATQAVHSFSAEMRWSFSADASACDVSSCQELAACLSDDSNAVSCSTTETCACEGVSLWDRDYSNPYTNDGTALVSDALGRNPGVQNPYCVQGDRLRIWTPRYRYELTDVPCQPGAGGCPLEGGPPDNLPSRCVAVEV
jgi:hypothetical protein